MRNAAVWLAEPLHRRKSSVAVRSVSYLIVLNDRTSIVFSILAELDLRFGPCLVEQTSLDGRKRQNELSRADGDRPIANIQTVAERNMSTHSANLAQIRVSN